MIGKEWNDDYCRIYAPLRWWGNDALVSFGLDIHSSALPLGLSLSPSCYSFHTLFLVHFIVTFTIFFFLYLLSCTAVRNITTIFKDQREPVSPTSPEMHCMASSMCLHWVDHINNELSRICLFVSIYRIDHWGQDKGSVKCGDDRNLQCQRLGCDILPCSGLKSLAAVLPRLPLHPSLSLLPVSSLCHLCSVS